MSLASVLQASSSVLTGEPATELQQHWFERLVRHYVHAYRQAHPTSELATTVESPDARARRVIARSSLLSAATGAASGAISTGAELAAQTNMAFVTIPAALVAVGGEALLRIKLHVELTCALADMFQVQFNVDDPSDLWRLYALTFNTRSQEPGESDQGRGLVSNLTASGEGELARELGGKLVRETLLRNLIPGIAVATSAYTNYVTTHRLGDNVRRYMRYQRALQDAFSVDADALREKHGLLIEGIWFVFSADGTLNPEETALLANLLGRISPVEREQVLRRFTLDEQDWLGRIAAEIDPEHRASFQRALEVAAAVDKVVGLPEQKILKRAATVLGTDFDLSRVERMIGAFEADGVLPHKPH